MKKENIAITVNDLHVYYRDMNRFSLKKGMKGRGSGKIFKAVKGVSFEIPKGQILGICGKNGSGKSTLLRAISGIFSADKGSINLHKNTISKYLKIGKELNWCTYDVKEKREKLKKDKYSKK